ncbi:hypothetical protein MMYC01_206903 [Madurella mycetomatis]|uniref:DUF6590 domain-containing protein n=1 Tax=Madurella mycetomatis TaxID=100816 RepID=A0A175W304_9PEZI|nr:hypothetical protein MMYC01_206903 [Madurella mycetomatis]
MDPSRQERWGEWGEWTADPAQDGYWRGGQDDQGNVSYGFLNPNTAEQTSPRGGDVEGIADSLSTINLSGQGTHYTQEADYTHRAEDPTGPAFPSSTAYHPTPSAGANAAYGAPSKNKGKATDPYAKSKLKGHRVQSGDKASSSKKPKPRPGKGYAETRPENPATSQVIQDPFYRKSGTPSGPDYTPAPDHTGIDPETYMGQAYGCGYSENPNENHLYNTYGSNYTPASGHDYVNPETYPGQAYEASSHGSTYVPGVSENSDADHRYDNKGSSAHHNAEENFEEGDRYGHHYRASGLEPGLSKFNPEDQLKEKHIPGYQSTAFASTGDPLTPTEDNGQLEAAVSQSDPYLTGAPTGPYHPGDPSSIPAAHGYPYPPYEIGSGHQTPRAPDQAVVGLTEEYQPLDNASAKLGLTRELEMHDGYVVAHSSMFRPGEVFKILWCEPLGAGPPRSEIITGWVGMQVNGKPFYQGFRRFIVVANDEGHCTCVPILTYEHKACTKRGVKPSKHGIIYQVGKKPRMVDGEPKLGFHPVRVDLYEKSEKLDKESRVNYAKLTTVEHNFRVFFIGRIVREDFESIVTPAIDQCWNRKRRHH